MISGRHILEVSEAADAIVTVICKHLGAACNVSFAHITLDLIRRIQDVLSSEVGT